MLTEAAFNSVPEPSAILFSVFGALGRVDKLN